MFYALGMEDADLKKDVAAFVALSPCVVPSNPPFSKDDEGNFVKWTLEDLRDGLVANVEDCPNAFGKDFDDFSEIYYGSIGDVAPAIYKAEFGDELFNPMRSRSSSAVKPFGTKLTIQLLATSITGEMKKWDEAFMTDPVGTELEAVDLSKVDVPTFLLYGAKDTVCPMNLNEAALESVSSVKRTVTYDKLGQLSFYKTDPQILADVVTILGSGAQALVVAATALTMLSIV